MLVACFAGKAFHSNKSLFSKIGKMKKCVKYLKILIVIFSPDLITTHLLAQPYVDPLQIRYTNAFSNAKAEATPFMHLWAGSDIPFKIKKNTYLLLSPYYELWKIDSANNKEIVPTVKSFTLGAGLIFPLKNPKWSVTILPVLRWNSEQFFLSNSMQLGTVAFASYALKQQQKFRFGIYINKEFFGLYVVPLLGIDWRIDKKNYLYGILPGRLTYEHQWNMKFYWGASFRAITNSYRLVKSQFLRLDDNQLSLYLDYYPAKKFCITLEPGFGLLRKMRKGTNSTDYISSINWGDGLFIKLSSSYRIRL
jgi:hypothetical protein